jgi:hypothetical protein
VDDITTYTEQLHIAQEVKAAMEKQIAQIQAKEAEPAVVLTAKPVEAAAPTEATAQAAATAPTRTSHIDISKEIFDTAAKLLEAIGRSGPSLGSLTLTSKQFTQWQKSIQFPQKKSPWNIEELHIIGEIISPELFEAACKDIDSLTLKCAIGTDIPQYVTIPQGCKKLIVDDYALFLQMEILDLSAADPNCQLWHETKQVPLTALIGGGSEGIVFARSYTLTMPGGSQGITWSNAHAKRRPATYGSAVIPSLPAAANIYFAATRNGSLSIDADLVKGDTIRVLASGLARATALKVEGNLAGKKIELVDVNGNVLMTPFDDTKNVKPKGAKQWNPLANLDAVIALLSPSCTSICLNQCGINQLNMTSYEKRTFPYLKIEGVDTVSIDGNTAINEMGFFAENIAVEINRDTVTGDGTVGKLTITGTRIERVMLNGNQTIKDIDISACGRLRNLDLDGSAVEGKTLTITATTLSTVRFLNLGKNHMKSEGTCASVAGKEPLNPKTRNPMSRYEPGFDSERGNFTGADVLVYFSTQSPIMLANNALDLGWPTKLQVFQCGPISIGTGSSEINVIGQASELQVLKCQPGNASVLNFSNGNFSKLYAVVVGGPTLVEVKNLPHRVEIFNSMECATGCCFELKATVEPSELEPTDPKYVPPDPRKLFRPKVCSLHMPDDIGELDLNGGGAFLEVSGSALTSVKTSRPTHVRVASGPGCTVETAPGGAIYSNTGASASAEITPTGIAFTDPDLSIFDANRAITVNTMLHNLFPVNQTDIRLAMGITEPVPAPKDKPAVKPATKGAKPSAPAPVIVTPESRVPRAWGFPPRSSI